MTGLFIGREWDPDTPRGKTRGGPRVKVAIYRPKREASEEANPANTLIWGFQRLNL